MDIGIFLGNNSGAGIFITIHFGKALQSDDLHVPPTSSLPSAPDLDPVNDVAVADEAFPMKHFLIQPYPDNYL